MPNMLKLLLYDKQHIIIETAKYDIHSPLSLQLLLLLEHWIQMQTEKGQRKRSKDTKEM